MPVRSRMWNHVLQHKLIQIIQRRWRTWSNQSRKPCQVSLPQPPQLLVVQRSSRTWRLQRWNRGVFSTGGGRRSPGPFSKERSREKNVWPNICLGAESQCDPMWLGDANVMSHVLQQEAFELDGVSATRLLLDDSPLKK